ncbi:hypothetical protein QOZ80_6AG0518390 [Eleusine coracana subsp. coracana]|nr:hypothetical protein QOZ80_6AG0518390 [Eleusine coracana subsp. coracana]
MEAIVLLLSLLLVTGAGGRSHANPAAAAAVTPSRTMAPNVYWQAVLPGTSMPVAIQDIVTQSAEHTLSYEGSMVQEMKGPMEKCHSRKPDLVKIPRKIGQHSNPWKKAEMHPYENQKSIMFKGAKSHIFLHGSQVEEDSRKITTTYGNYVQEDVRKTTMETKYQGEQESRKITTSYGTKVGVELSKTTTPYEPQHDEDGSQKITRSYGSHDEVDRKKITFSYGSKVVEDPTKTTILYGSENGEDPKKITMSYRLSSHGEDQKKITMSYGSQDGKDEEDPKKTTISYWSRDEKDVGGPKKIPMSYGSQVVDDPKKMTLSYGSHVVEDPKKITMSYRSQYEEDPKKITLSYGSQVVEDPKNITVSYKSQHEEDPKNIKLLYGSQVLGDPKKITVSYRSKDEEDPKKTTLSYRSKDEEDPKKITLSYRSNDEEDPKKITMLYEAQVIEDSKNIKMSYMSKDEADPKKTTMTYKSKDEEDPKKVTLSYWSQDGKDPKKITLSYGSRVGEPSNDRDRHAHIHSDNNGRKMLADVFFFHDALRPGSVITPTIPPTTSLPALLPRHIADSIPFSTERSADIIAMFKPTSLGMASEIRWTLDTCKNPRPLPGEKAGCASSLESLIDLSVALLGTRNVRAFSADMPADPAGRPARRGTYKITAMRKLSESPEIATCHDLTYPYAVFFCHTTNPAVVYAVTLEAAVEGAAPSAMEVVAVCHLDTSLWSPITRSSSCTISSQGTRRRAISFQSSASFGFQQTPSREVHLKPSRTGCVLLRLCQLSGKLCDVSTYVSYKIYIGLIMF